MRAIPRIWISFAALVTLCFLCHIPAEGAYQDNGNGTVTDSETGLSWQQADDGVERNWKDALAYCEGLRLAGYSDWRLPNARELESVVDWSRYSPAIDSSFSCQSSYYWSSSTYANYTDEAFFCSFYSGWMSYDPKSDVNYARCVRDGVVAPVEPVQYTADLTSLWPPDQAAPGGSTTLWAEVKNTCTASLPSNAYVWFFVWGPNVFDYVGAASVYDLASGASQWYAFNWTVPADAESGTYTYWAAVATDVWISEWSYGQSFNVGGTDAWAEIPSLNSVPETLAGAIAILGANVRSAGTSALPGNAYVCFMIYGPAGIYEWAGWTSVAGLAPGASQEYDYTWLVPGGALEGSYSYWAVVLTTDGLWLSDWSVEETFNITIGGVDP